MAKKEKSQYEALFLAQSIGGFPLTLLVLGVILMSGGVVDGLPKVFGETKAELWVFSGLGVVGLAAVVWVIRALITYRTRSGLMRVMQEMVKGAASCSAKGADYEHALKNMWGNFGKVVLSLGKDRTSG